MSYFLLKEDADKLLLETGDSILLESYIPPEPTSPNRTKKDNYNGYLAFTQQFIKHRINDTTPWSHPDGFLIE